MTFEDALRAAATSPAFVVSFNGEAAVTLVGLLELALRHPALEFHSQLSADYARRLVDVLITEATRGLPKGDEAAGVIREGFVKRRHNGTMRKVAEASVN